MGRNTASFNRANSQFKPQPTVLILCEDSKSGKTYLEDASKHFRAHTKVEIAHCGKTDPKGIINEAIKRQAKFDQVFCVIDRDTHPSFNEAIQLASSHLKVTIIKSYPCFEFWLLLHFGHTRKPYTAGDLLNRDLCSKAGMENYNKGSATSTFARLLGEQFNNARIISPQVLAQANSEQEFNPSTELHLLIDRLEELSQPQPAHN
ncbi:MAG: RloB family protein [Sideroxydans sp.]|nr:RloB family protein [Sideroxydans sp.]